MKHQHQYGPWKMHKQGENKGLPDKEYASTLRFPPFWFRKCSCGFEHWHRCYGKPKAATKFSELWGTRAL